MRIKTVLITTMILTGSVLFAEETNAVPDATEETSPKRDLGFAGPAATTSQLAEDSAEKIPAFRLPWIGEQTQPWFDFKTKLNEEHGFQLGAAYTILYQEALGEDSAGSGILRINGAWELLNRGSENSGTLVFSIDHRHRYNDLAPADLGFATGYLGIPGTLFSNAGLLLGDLNWQQALNDGQSGLIIGRYDPNDFFDVLGYANPWTAFQNLAVLFNASIALPDWSTGIGGGHWFTDQWYLKAAVNDVNGVANEVNFFEDFGELYTTAEVGWSPSREQRYLSNIHLTAWHADERDEAGVDESEGITIGANWTVDETWMGFLKAGWSDGTAPLYNESLTAGLIYHVAARSDLAGLAVNWGSPADNTLRDQTTSELFYRLQLAQNLAITPSIQLVVDPALNPDEDQLWIAGLRIRLTL